LYRNNGDGTFTDVTVQAGLTNDPKRWGAGCSFVDYNRDGHLDLFVSNYVRFELENIPKPGSNSNCDWKGIPVNCGLGACLSVFIHFTETREMGLSPT